jgi:hypothetical protein
MHRLVTTLIIETRNDLEEDRELRLAAVTRALNQSFGPGNWKMYGRVWEDSSPIPELTPEKILGEKNPIEGTGQIPNLTFSGEGLLG